MIRWIKKILRRPGDLLFATRLEQQNIYNLEVLDSLEDLDQALRDMRNDVPERIEKLHRDIASMQNHFQAAFTELQEEMERLRDRAFPTLMEQVTAMIDGVDAKAEWSLARTRRFMAMIHESMMSRFSPESMVDLDAAAFQDTFRGNEKPLRERLRRYVSILADHAPVWDLGCGRGDLLRLMREEGTACVGVDGNGAQVATLQEEGFDTRQGDCLAVLSAEPEDSMGAIVMFHLLEHLSPREVMPLLRNVRSHLQPGGICVVEVPNVQSLTGLFNFFKDPEHIHPWQPETLEHALAESGFTDIEIQPINPVPDSHHVPAEDNAPAALKEAIRRINRLLYGCLDLSATAKRPVE